MRAFTLDSLEIPAALREDLPAPTPWCGEILVRVTASSANPVDNAIAAGMLAGMFEHTFPVVLGATSPGHRGDRRGGAAFAEGDEVFGFVPHADPTCTPALGRADHGPAGTDRRARARGRRRRAAGGAPLAGITALVAVDALDLSEGDALLVVGATAVSAASPSSSPPRPAPRSSRPRCPRTRRSCATSASPTCVPRDADLAGLDADALLDLVSYAPGAFDTALKDGARRLAEQRRRRGRAAPTSWPPPTATACRASARCSPTAHCACPSKPPTTLPTPATRSQRSRVPTPRASTPSASPELSA